VPQLADAAEVLSHITRTSGVTYSALTPNVKGFERALEAGVNEVAVFAAASETFSLKNINCSIQESYERFRPIFKQAAENNIAVRGYVSCIAGCPYEGKVAPKSVREVSEELLNMGCYQISLGDTIGSGTPDIISKVLEEVLTDIEPKKLAGHYHDTNGRALDNVMMSLKYGLTTFDSAIGGLGGCPYAPGAKGNLSTGKLAQALSEAGYDTGLNLSLLREAEKFIHSMVPSAHSTTEASPETG